MSTALDRSAFIAAMEAFWDAPTGNDKGVEAAIIAYLERVGLTDVHDATLSVNAQWKEFFTTKLPTLMQAAE